MFDREKSGDTSRLLLISAAAFVVRAARPCSTLPYAFSHLVLTLSSPSTPPLQARLGGNKKKRNRQKDGERENSFFEREREGQELPTTDLFKRDPQALAADTKLQERFNKNSLIIVPLSPLGHFSNSPPPCDTMRSLNTAHIQLL